MLCVASGFCGRLQKLQDLQKREATANLGNDDLIELQHTGSNTGMKFASTSLKPVVRPNFEGVARSQREGVDQSISEDVS